MKEDIYKIEERELISTPLPEQTATYKPVGHQQLIDLTLESIYQAGFEIAKKEYRSSKGGQIANARYVIKNVADDEMQLMVGFQNSYDKSLSVKWAIGTQIMICSNGCVSGDFGAFKRKHTGDVQTFTPQHIVEHIKHAGDTFRQIQNEREQMKEIEISKRTMAELIGRMIIEEEIIQSTQLNIIEREMKHPTYEYGNPNSLWTLYQYTTFAMKELHPFLWMNSHLRAHRFFTEAAGIIHSEPKITIPVSPIVAPNQLDLFQDSLIY